MAELDKKLISFGNLRTFKENSDERYIHLDDQATVQDILDLFGEIIKPGEGSGSDNKVTVTLSNYILELQPQESATLSAFVSPADAENKELFWVVTDESVINLSPDGTVTALKNGTAVVVVLCAASGNYATCTVSVKTPGSGSDGESETPTIPVAQFTAPAVTISGTTLYWTANTFATNGYTVRIVNDAVTNLTINASQLDLTSVLARSSLQTGRNIITVKVNATPDRLESDWSEPPLLYAIAAETEQPEPEVPGERVLDSIYISSMPTKVTYYKNSKIDLEGLEVIALYSDLSKEVIPLSELAIGGFDTSSAGPKVITLTYKNKVASYNIMVLSSEVPDFEDEHISLPGFYNSEDVLLARWDEPNKIIIYSEGESTDTEVEVDVSANYTSTTYKSNIKSPYNAILKVEEYLYDQDETVTKVLLPESITSIGEYAFYGLESLDKVMLSSSISSIGTCAFGGNNLKALSVAASNTTYYSKDNCIISTNAPRAVVAGCKNSKIPKNDGIKSITAYAFYMVLGGPKHLVIPGSVSEIGDYAFYGCYSLVDVTLETGVERVGAAAFYTYNSVNRRYGITDIYLPSTLKSIGRQSFSSYIDITKVHIDSVAAWCDIERDVTSFSTGVSGSSVYDENLYNSYTLCLGDVPLTEIAIPDGVIEIKPYSFSHICNPITSITLSDTVQTVASTAFYCCAFGLYTGLRPILILGQNTKFVDDSIHGICFSGIQTALNKNYVYSNGMLMDKSGSTLVTVCVPELPDQNYLDIPGTVSKISAYACANPSSNSVQTTIIIPESVVEVGDYAFYQQNKCQSLELPKSLQRVGRRAFAYMSALMDVQINSNFYIPDGMTLSASCFAYSGSTAGTSVLTINQGVTRIAPYIASYARFKTIRIAESVECIGCYAFYSSSTQYIENIICKTGEWSYANKEDATQAEKTSIQISSSADAISYFVKKYTYYYFNSN